MISVLFKLLSFDSDALYEFTHKFSTVNSPFTWWEIFSTQLLASTGVTVIMLIPSII